MARDAGPDDQPHGAAASFADETAMTADDSATAESLAFAEGISIGQGLKAAREREGFSLEEIAAYTRVRRAHLEAIEMMDFEHLPSRPFAVGYVRAYAEALGLDEMRAVARFRAEWPDESSESLPNPIGVDDGPDPRRRLLAIAGVGVLAAIVIWNVAQRAMSAREAPKSEDVVAQSVPDAPLVKGPVELGEPVPPPVEATLPTPYVTPGLEDIDPDIAQAEAAAAAQVKRPPVEPLPFIARGPVYGAPADQSIVTLQAVRNVLLVIRDNAGNVFEARQMKAGESYRAPENSALVVDVSVPDSVEYYVGGVLQGPLQQTVTPLSRLARQ